MSLLLWLPAGSSWPEGVFLFLFMIQQTAETVRRERISEKYDFLMQWFSFGNIAATLYIEKDVFGPIVPVLWHLCCKFMYTCNKTSLSFRLSGYLN